jgi:uncharacterized protein (DUF3820 family)
MKQRKLFTKKQLGPGAARIWDVHDAIPFGRYKGQTLATIAAIDPAYMEWWQTKHRKKFSLELQFKIRVSKHQAL